MAGIGPTGIILLMLVFAVIVVMALALRGGSKQRQTYPLPAAGRWAPDPTGRHQLGTAPGGRLLYLTTAFLATNPSNFPREAVRVTRRWDAGVGCVPDVGFGLVASLPRK